MLRTILPAALTVVMTGGALAQIDAGPHESEQASFSIEVVAEGLEFPWALAFVPGGGLLVTEREGRLRVVDRGGVLRAEPVAGLPDDILVERQGGLMDVALHPDFATNRFVYISYAQGSSEANGTALGRGQLSADLSRLEGFEQIYRVNFDKRGGLHFGGRVLFQADGSLFLTLGEGGRYIVEAQNTENALGSVVHLRQDGTPMASNPFASGGGDPAIYSFGHRNVQGIDRNPATGSIWTVEHGPRGGDELNVLQPGANYGWPEISYGINYNGSILTEDRARDGMMQPYWYWVPSIAPAGLAFYQGDAFPEWQGDLFVPALAGMALHRLEMDGDRVISQEALLEPLGYRYRDVRSGPDGAIYVLTDDLDGHVLRLVPSP